MSDHQHEWLYIGGKVGWQCQTCWHVEAGPGHTAPPSAPPAAQPEQESDGSKRTAASIRAEIKATPSPSPEPVTGTFAEPAEQDTADGVRQAFSIYAAELRAVQDEVIKAGFLGGPSPSACVNAMAAEVRRLQERASRAERWKLNAETLAKWQAEALKRLPTTALAEINAAIAEQDTAGGVALLTVSGHQKVEAALAAADLLRGKEHPASTLAAHLETLAAEVRRLQERASRAERDAERWRWFRKLSPAKVYDVANAWKPDQRDAVADAAIAEQDAVKGKP